MTEQIADVVAKQIIQDYKDKITAYEARLEVYRQNLCTCQKAKNSAPDFPEAIRTR